MRDENRLAALGTNLSEKIPNSSGLLVHFSNMCKFYIENCQSASIIVCDIHQKHAVNAISSI